MAKLADSIRYYDRDGHICLLSSMPFSNRMEAPRAAVYRVCVYEKLQQPPNRFRKPLKLPTSDWQSY